MSDKATTTIPDDEPGKEMVVAGQQVRGLDLLSDKSMGAVYKLGATFHESGMFGCASPEQGRMIALTCIMMGTPPAVIMQKYHIIQGNLSMQGYAILASFRKLPGADHTVLERTPDCVEIEFKLGRKKLKFRFTFEEAKLEPFAWTVDKKSKEKILSSNYATPRKRMQMMTWRVVSDAVKVMAPECMEAGYVPEDFGGMTSESDADADYASRDAIDAGFTVVTEATEAAAEPPFEPTPEPQDSNPGPPADDSVASMESEPVDTITKEQLSDIGRLKKSLGIPDEKWKNVLSKFDVVSAYDLDTKQADQLEDSLQRRVDADDSKKN
jgi:hypothetical protein